MLSENVRDIHTYIHTDAHVYDSDKENGRGGRGSGEVKSALVQSQFILNLVTRGLLVRMFL